MLQWCYLGQVPYETSWQWQKILREQRIAGTIPDTLLLLEHPPTITLGRLRGEESVLLSSEQQTHTPVAIIRSDRGGDATLHAPGQLVGYLIVNLRERNLSLPVFVETIAQVVISYLRQSHGIEAHYDPKYPGVWVGNNKITAFGFHLHQDVTMHGFAFNLSTDLSLFQWIVPCGLVQKGVTSLAQLGILPPSCAELSPQLATGIARVLSLEPFHHPGLLQSVEPLSSPHQH